MSNNQTPPHEPNPPSSTPPENDNSQSSVVQNQAMETTATDSTEIRDDLDPAEKDARWMRRWYPTSFVTKLAIAVLLILAGMLAGLYYAAGTQAGTRYIINAIVQQTGISLKVGDGNLRDGLWIYDLHIPQRPPKSYIEVNVDKAYVKMGWRAIFYKEVHLREATIGNLTIFNHKPPTGQPFAYDKIALPVNLRINHANATLIRYQQAPKEPSALIATASAVDKIATAASATADTNNQAVSPVINEATQVKTEDIPSQTTGLTIDFKQDEITDFTWVDSQITVKRADLHYNDLLNITNLSGNIDLQNDYPLDATASVIINPLSKVYFDAIDAHVTGSLKNVTASFTSRYNASDIEGTITAQPLEKNAPFDGKVTWKDIALPYAKTQDIHLRQGTLIASGVTNDIQLEVDTQLSAKDIPDGHYHGQAVTDGKTMKIGNLAIETAEGKINTQGILDWQGRFNASLMSEGHGFKIRKLLSKDVAPYAPETLDGKIAVVYNQPDVNNPMDIKVNLRQDDGEVINAHITQNQVTPDKNQGDKDNPPMNILASWQNYIRHDVPNIGEINSPTGRADVIVEKVGQEQHVTVIGKAKINEFNIAPKGDYDVNVKKHGNIVDINRLIYNGVIGDLDGKGHIQLAHRNQPLTWEIDAKTNTLKAHDFNKSIPFSKLSGTLSAKGVMQKIGSDRNNPITRHSITIKDIDMAGDMISTNTTKAKDGKEQEKINATRHLKLTGAGDIEVNLLKNKLNDFAVKFEGNLTAPSISEGKLDGKLSLDIAGTPKNITIHDFKQSGKAGAINAKGKLDLNNGMAWDISADMQNFDASYFVANMPSSITGSVVSDGYWHDDTQQINISQMNLTGKLKNQPLVATGKLYAILHLPKDLSTLGKLFSSPNEQGTEQTTLQNRLNNAQRLIEQMNADNLKIMWGNNQITANGNQNQLVASVNVSTLNQIIPQLQGTVKGGLSLSQDTQQKLPNVYVDLIGYDVRMPNFAVLNAKLNGKLVNMAKLPSQLQLTATGINISNQPIRALTVEFNGTQADHWLNIKADSTKGQLQASLKGAIDLDKQQWNGVLGNGQVGTKYAQLQQLQPAQMALDWGQSKLQLAAHCWQMVGQTGRLCLKDNLVTSKEEGQINASLQEIDGQIFSVFMPKDIAWKGQLNGNALIHWKKGQHPTINASIYTDNGVIGLAPDTPDETPMTVDYDRISLIARSSSEGLKLRADIKTSNGTGTGYIDAVIDPYRDNKPIDGTVVLQDINLSILKPFLPSFQSLSGNGVVAGKISGTLAQPKFLGDIEIENGAMSVTGLPVKLNNMNILTHVSGNQALVEGSFNSAGEGKGTITGTVDWTKELQAKLKVQGTKIQISQPPLLFAEVNPLLDIIVKPQQKYVDIEGIIDVPRATIRPPEANKDVITKSSDVTVIDRRLAGQIGDVLKVVEPWSINADVAVDLGERVFFRGFGANLPLAGAINITQQGQGVMKAQGMVLVAKRSKVDIFGQNLNINYAQVRFDGNISKPTINVEGVKEIQGVTVGVRVKGDTSSPNITVFNNGGLSDQQAMNALVTGSLNNTTGESTSTEEFKSRVNNTIAAAGLSFGLQGTRRFTNQIGRAFGLQSLTLDASGTGSDTEVNLTGYITPDLYIRYGVGVFNSTNALSMRYQLTKRLYIEAKSAATNSVDLLYNWKF